MRLRFRGPKCFKGSSLNDWTILFELQSYVSFCGNVRLFSKKNKSVSSRCYFFDVLLFFKTDTNATKTDRAADARGLDMPIALVLTALANETERRL